MSARRALLLLAALAVLVAGGYYGYKYLDAQPVQHSLQVDGQPHDGDTFRVLLNGRSEPVRILGINAPEISPPECGGPEAQDEVRSLLTGQNVLLTSDPGQGNRDRYERLLRYADVPEIGDLGAHLIREGYARVYEEYPVSRTGEYLRLQQQAQQEGKGIWGSCS